MKISDIDGIFVDDTGETITEKGLSESSAKLFPKGTILFTIFATIGKVGVLEIEAATNQAIVGIQVKVDDLDPLYLAYFLSYFGRQVASEGRGMAQNNINQAILRALPVPVPPLSVQRRIVGRVEGLLAEGKKARVLLEEMHHNANRLLPSVINQVLAGVLGAMETVPLSEVATAFNGRASGAGDSAMRVFKTKHVYPPTLRLDRPSYMKAEQVEKLRSSPEVSVISSKLDPSSTAP